MAKVSDSLSKMEINGFVPVTKNEKRNQSMGMSHMNKSKDKPFRIMKKTMEKKEEPYGVGNLGLIMVTGLGQQMGQSTASR